MPLQRFFDWVRSLGVKDEPVSGPLLIVITPQAESPGEIRTVKKLFEAGLPRLHLRRHDWGVESLRDWLERIPRRYRSRIVLHGHPELAVEMGLAGVHLQSPVRRKPHGGSSSRPQRFPEGLEITRSCHDYGELSECPAVCAYATLGPVFPSVSKRGYGPRRTPEEFAAIIDFWKKENKGYPIVALGGVTPDNIGTLAAMGFSGAAVVGSVWESPSPVEAFKALRSGWLRGSSAA